MILSQNTCRNKKIIGDCPALLSGCGCPLSAFKDSLSESCQSACPLSDSQRPRKVSSRHESNGQQVIVSFWLFPGRLGKTKVEKVLGLGKQFWRRRATFWRESISMTVRVPKMGRGKLDLKKQLLIKNSGGRFRTACLMIPVTLFPGGFGSRSWKRSIQCQLQ